MRWVADRGTSKLKSLCSMEYRYRLQKKISHLLLLMIVGTWQILKQAKLEILAEALPIPILFESRRKKLKRFLKLEILNIEKSGFPA